ncbi:MAG: hypothetical protein ACOZAO_04305 [Patescibacteria group bacterium]
MREDILKNNVTWYMAFGIGDLKRKKLKMQARLADWLSIHTCGKKSGIEMLPVVSAILQQEIERLEQLDLGTYQIIFLRVYPNHQQPNDFKLEVILLERMKDVSLMIAK